MHSGEGKYRLIGLIRRTFHYMDQEVFRLLFTSLMRPHMDYADCIWSPHLKVDIAQLENAQRRATRLVPDLRDRCYEARLRALNLPSLLYRGRLMDMIQTFGIMTGIDDLEASDFFTMNSRETRGYGKKIMKQPSRLNLRKFSLLGGARERLRIRKVLAYFTEKHGRRHFNDGISISCACTV